MEKYRRKVYLDRTEESQSLLTSNNDDYMQMGNLILYFCENQFLIINRNGPVSVFGIFIKYFSKNK